MFTGNESWSVGIVRIIYLEQWRQPVYLDFKYKIRFGLRNTIMREFANIHANHYETDWSRRLDGAAVDFEWVNPFATSVGPYRTTRRNFLIRDDGQRLPAPLARVS